MNIPRTLGVSTFAVYDVPLVQGFAELIEAGFKQIEIMCEDQGLECLGWSRDEMNAIQQQLREEEVTVTIHAPFLLCNPASDDINVRTKSLVLIRDCLKLASHFNCPYVLLHLGTHDHSDLGLKNSISFLEQLVSFIPDGTKIALENVPPKPGFIGSTIDELLEVCSRFPSEKFGIVYDVGHANLLEGERVVTEMISIIDHLIGLHISDNYGKEDEHNCVGDGTVPFSLILHELQERHLEKTVTMVLETKNIEDSIKSVNRMTELVLRKETEA